MPTKTRRLSPTVSEAVLGGGVGMGCIPRRNQAKRRWCLGLISKSERNKHRKRAMNWLLLRISCGCREFWSQTITDLHLFLDLILVFDLTKLHSDKDSISQDSRRQGAWRALNWQLVCVLESLLPHIAAQPMVPSSHT